MTQCGKCGQAISSGDAFCAACGAAVVYHDHPVGSPSTGYGGQTSGTAPGPHPRATSPALWVVIAIGGLFLILVLVGVVAAVVIPSVLQTGRTARQAAVQEVLRNLATSERVYASQTEGGGYGTLGQLASRGFIDASLAVEPVRVEGYRIRTEWIDHRSFCFSATPESEGDARYYIDDSMTIREGLPPGRPSGYSATPRTW